MVDKKVVVYLSNHESATSNEWFTKIDRWIEHRIPTGELDFGLECSMRLDHAKARLAKHT
jgi:hypothetical protein